MFALVLRLFGLVRIRPGSFAFVLGSFGFHSHLCVRFVLVRTSFVPVWARLAFIRTRSCISCLFVLVSCLFAFGWVHLSVSNTQLVHIIIKKLTL